MFARLAFKCSDAPAKTPVKNAVGLLLATVITATALTVPLSQEALAQSSTNPLKGQAQEVKVIDYPDAQRSAQGIIDQLESANGLAGDTVKQVRVVKADDLNAATDGEQVMVSSALWNLLKTEDQRAFVLSHEVSHITLNHVGQTQIRRLGLGLLGMFLSRNSSADAGVRSQLTQVATAAGLSLVDNKFSRSNEYQADDNGLRLMQKAGYNPHAALQVFEIFEQQMPNGMPEFLQSHPLNKSRIQALLKKYPNASASR
ncbi:MAG: M48 family metallopeptidase [Vampirovibrionales bacterium]|nr:M48 family metallopeptidase [Vampirovibrionales bacterium]